MNLLFILVLFRFSSVATNVTNLQVEIRKNDCCCVTASSVPYK